MAALFAQGIVFEGGDGAALGGLRVYFGQNDKTLIRRHREDDTPTYGENIMIIICGNDVPLRPGNDKIDICA